MAKPKQKTEVMELSLIDTAKNFSSSVQSLHDLKAIVRTLPTHELGQGYAMVKAFETGFTELVKEVRDEFIGTQDDDGNYLGDGRLFKEADPKDNDDNGNMTLKLPDGTVLKASKSVRATFDADKAIDVLKDHGLMKQGSDRVTQVKDEDAFDAAITFVRDRMTTDDYTEFFGILSAAMEVRFTPNKHKIEALMITEQLPTSEVENLFNEKVLYSLLLNKNQYKLRK